jgi:FG-GAP repeat
MRALPPRLFSRILMVAGAIVTITVGPETVQRRFRGEPPSLGGPVDLPALIEPAREIYPALGDLDGDGRADLLVGDGMGRMEYHRNVGTVARLELAPPIWFDELCPDGRIPTG